MDSSGKVAVVALTFFMGRSDTALCSGENMLVEKFNFFFLTLSLRDATKSYNTTSMWVGECISNRQQIKINRIETDKYMCVCMGRQGKKLWMKIKGGGHIL